MSWKQLSGAAVTLVTVTALTLTLAGVAAAGDPEQTAEPQLGVGPAHWWKPGKPGKLGKYGTWGRTVAWRPASSLSILAVDNLANPGNGEIMPTTNTHLIFWLPAGFDYSSSVGDANYEAQMIKYFQDVGGSQILNTATQYSGNNGTIANTSTFIDSIVDTNAFPHTGADVAHAVTQTDLNTEIFNQIGAHAGWNKGMTSMYFVFLPNNVVDCNDALTSCNTNRYCAYHTYGYSGSDTPANDFVWADIPDNRSIYSAGGCGDSNVTGDESADTTLSSVEHEHLEAVTDPRLNAWQDSTGGAGENGDKCNRNMGVANSSKSIANNYLGGGSADLFRIQREWSNAVSGCAASYTTTGSGVESPAPSGGDVVLSVAEATIPGNPADSLHYTLTLTNPSNQDDAYNVHVTDTLPAGVQYLGSGTASFNLGDLAPHKSATMSFTAHPSGPLAAGATLTNTAKFDFDDSTGTAQPTITRTAVTTVVNAPPTLNALPDPQSVDYHDALSFGVSANDSDAGDTLLLSASGLPAGLTLTDNGDRTATVSGTAAAVPGDYVVTITVNDQHNTPVSAQMTIHVLHEQTTTAYTGPLVILAGSSSATLVGHLAEDASDTASPSGQTLTLSLGAQSCSGTTNAAGVASCTISPVTVPLGPEPLDASFAGDAYYLSSSDASKEAIVFALPDRGAFVLADSSVAAAGPTTSLTFWSDSWSSLNSLSGGVAPSAFKGFAADILGLPTATPPSSCGGLWTTTGGNSPPPTDSVPSYMGALVASGVSKSGSTISGNFGSIVVLKTAPGYSSNTGHPGIGTIVATYC